MGPLSHELQSSLTSPQQKSSTPWCLGKVSGVFLYNQKENSLISDSGLPSNPTKNPNGLIHPWINVYQASDYHRCSWCSNKQKSRSLLFILSLFRHLIGLLYLFLCIRLSFFSSFSPLLLLPCPTLPLFFFFVIFFFCNFIYLFIYGCVGSSFLCEGFL